MNTILGLLSEISFGQDYFEMAVLFRQSMLINGIFCNSEVLYGVSQKHIKKVEVCRQIFLEAGVSVPIFNTN